MPKKGEKMEKIITSVINKLCSEETMVKVVITLLEWLVESTQNKLDDELVKIVKEKLIVEME
tara:strand:+ start:815 stop:1000 length:186 start_codon:yes stop_codon:yes gene_type:complete